MYNPNLQADYTPDDWRQRSIKALLALRGQQAVIGDSGDFNVQPNKNVDYLSRAQSAMNNEASLREQVAAQRAKNRNISVANIPQNRYNLVPQGGGNPMGGGANFRSFAQAEKMQESGGNYGIVNHSSGALGAYQIMPANLASWGQQTVGHPIRSPQHFLSHPKQQDAVALTMLRRYYSKYGARGAASAWYSGNPNAWKTSSDVAKYVNSVLRRMGK